MWGGPEDEDYDYVTRDSGEKAVHSDGVQRDTQRGKRMFTLMFPKGVPLAQQLIVRVADLYTRGAEKYGDRNWENSKSADTLAHHEDALWRHFMNFYFGIQDGEDHAAAIVWNINAVELTRRNLQGSEVRQEIPDDSQYFDHAFDQARAEITDDQAHAAMKAAAAICSVCQQTWPCKSGCEYAAMVKPQPTESDMAFDNVRRACQANHAASDPAAGRDNPNDHRYH